MQLGRFEIMSSLEDKPEAQALLTEMNVLRRQPSFERAGVLEYLALHSDFDALKEGEAIPMYVFTFERAVDGSVKRRPAERR